MTAGAYDPTIYRGCAPYYARGRAPYSPVLAATLVAEVGAERSRRLLDVGCGPGSVGLALAGHFQEVVGLDPDAEMLAEAAARGARAGAGNVRWVRGRAEEILARGLGRFDAITFGQSFHWTDRERVAEMAYDSLEPGGAIVLIAHERNGRPQPAGPGYPPIPHEAIGALIARYLGTQRRAGQGFAAPAPDRYEAALARTRFGPPRIVYCDGCPDFVQDADGVMAGYLSKSFAAPHLFGDRLEAFRRDVREELAKWSPSGLFWEWPGDTVLVLAHRPA